MNAIVTSVLAEWRALDVSALQFWQRETAQVVLIALIAAMANGNRVPSMARMSRLNTIQRVIPRRCLDPDPARGAEPDRNLCRAGRVTVAVVSTCVVRLMPTAPLRLWTGS